MWLHASEGKIPNTRWRKVSFDLPIHGIDGTTCNFMPIFTHRKTEDHGNCSREYGVMVRRFFGKAPRVKRYTNENNRTGAHLHALRRNLKLHIEEYFSFFLNTMCLLKFWFFFFFFTLKLPLPLAINKEMFLLYPRIAGGSATVRCAVLWLELFQTACHGAFNTGQQATQFFFWLGSLGTQVWRIMALRNSVWYNQ